MMNHPSMTSRGRRLAIVVAVLLMMFLPKRVECGYPGATCGHDGIMRQYCKPYELEPLGFYLVEKLVERNVGFAYSRGEECH